VRHLTGNPSAAFRDFTEALDLFRSLGNCPGEIEALNDLGELLSDSSNSLAARDYHESAFAAARSINVPLEEARALEGIGRCLLNQGLGSGGDQLRGALAIYKTIKSSNAARVEDRLAKLGKGENSTDLEDASR